MLAHSAAASSWNQSRPRITDVRERSAVATVIDLRASMATCLFLQAQRRLLPRAAPFRPNSGNRPPLREHSSGMRVYSYRLCKDRLRMYTRLGVSGNHRAS